VVLLQLGKIEAANGTPAGSEELILKTVLARSVESAWEESVDALDFASKLHGEYDGSEPQADPKDAPLQNLPAFTSRDRLAPEYVAVLEVTRTPGTLRSALLEGPELVQQRMALSSLGLPLELPSGAKLFLRPDQYHLVLQAITALKWSLKPRHILVALEFEVSVTKVIESVGEQVKVKNRLMVETAPLFDQEGHQVRATIASTFIHVQIPSSLYSAPASQVAASW